MGVGGWGGAAAPRAQEAAQEGGHRATMRQFWTHSFCSLPLFSWLKPAAKFEGIPCRAPAITICRCPPSGRPPRQAWRGLMADLLFLNLPSCPHFYTASGGRGV